MQGCKLIGPVFFVVVSFFLRASFLHQAVQFSDYFLKEPFHYLNVDRVRSSQVLSAFECAHACLRETLCLSFNLAVSVDGGTLRCELLASDKYNAPAQLGQSQLYHHFSIMNYCARIKCQNGGKCVTKLSVSKCDCPRGFFGDTCEIVPSACSEIKSRDASSRSGSYVIDPDGAGGLAPFSVLCDMSDKGGVGVTVIGHDSENRTLADGCEPPGCYSCDVTYTGASLAQLASLTNVSSYCEQSIKYECLHARIYRGQAFSWLVSRDGRDMWYWGGAPPGSRKCACGVNGTCADSKYTCNCDKNDDTWREDSGLLTYKDDLPVSQLRFGDLMNSAPLQTEEKGYHTLGKLRCYNAAEQN